MIRPVEAWLINHEHDSTPFYMDGSAKAAVGLKPGANDTKPRRSG